MEMRQAENKLNVQEWGSSSLDTVAGAASDGKVSSPPRSSPAFANAKHVKKILRNSSYNSSTTQHRKVRR
jgi:hypothetical protein